MSIFTSTSLDLSVTSLVWHLYLVCFECFRHSGLWFASSARMGAEHARARHWPRGVTEAAGCAGAPPPPPRPAGVRGKAALRPRLRRRAQVFRLWRQRAHLCLWTWLMAITAIWCLALGAIMVFQWNSVIVVNYSRGVGIYESAKITSLCSIISRLMFDDRKRLKFIVPGGF